MRELSLNDLEVEIVKEIKNWCDEMIKAGDIELMIDAGDAAELAGNIAIHIIGHGVGIVGAWEAHRKLSEGWE
jgi:hypothetical protein